MTPLEKLQSLFRELFQLDLADLDFGIYRLLRLKRDEVEAFLTEQLPRRVKETFAGMAEDERAALERSVADLQSRIRAEVAEDAILPDGQIAPDYREVRVRAARELLDEYRAARERLAAVAVTEAQQAEVFNHLYNFFSRYYEGGDFIARRRYGAREAYAVPYNGEETFFYWANRDQHYVKTAEAFRDYAFTVDTLSGTYRVRFTLTQASVPPGNVKGETRYFFPQVAEMAWDAEARTLRVPFHYRLPTEKEAERYGKNVRFQEGVLEEALPKILEAVPDPVLREALAQVVDRREDEEVTLLKKRLRHFTRKQTTDYFIHKDLGGFLRRELEFYLKDQVLSVADLDGDLDAKRRMLRVVRELAGEVITFLAQIEDAQKRLFEKRKFVLRTDYLVPIMHVPRELWPQVVANPAQVEAWRDLFAIDPEKDLFNPDGDTSEAFLEGHPTLVVNTEHFGEGFKDRLMESFQDIDEATDGLLIHAENYQALRLLQRKYGDHVKFIYIDPPYNTGSDGFVYKDRYRHSSWLAMMKGRLSVARTVLADEGVVFVSIDDNEAAGLRLLGNQVFGDHSFLGQITWKTTTDNNPSQIAIEHEYVLSLAKDPTTQGHWSAPSEKAAMLMKRYEELRADHGTDVTKIQRELRRWIREHSRKLQGVTHFNSVDSKGVYSAQNPANPHPGGYVYEVLHPITRKPCGVPTNGFRFPKETFEKLAAEGDIEFGPDETVIPKPKKRLDVSRDFLRSVYYEDNRVSVRNLEEMFGKRVYENPKSLNLLRALLRFSTGETALALDFFAGSGTTGHAVILLNRETGSRCRFMLVEMADYFDTVLLPRIQKAMFAPEWKDGKPARLPTEEEAERTPRLVKHYSGESYDDTLHNVAVEDTVARTRDRAEAHATAVGGDECRLRYLVRLPLEASASMLRIDHLEHPFDFTIEVLAEDGPKSERVDLIETFNFLYGIHVRRLETWLNEDDRNRRYRVVKGKTRDNRRLLVLWRDMTDLDPAVERRFLEPKIEAEGPFDEILINGNCAVPGVQSLDGLFKRLMEEGET